MYTQGRKNRAIKVADGSTIVVNYGFVSLFWIFNFTYGYKYSLAAAAADGSTNYKNITKEEATRANGGKVVAPPALERYSFLIIVGIALIAFLWRTFAS